MPFTLKNKELQAKLDEISDGDFSKRLNDTYIRSIYPFDGLISISFGPYVEGLRRFDVHLSNDDIGEILEFNPNDWNPFPNVKPPEGVWMRCEREGYKFCAAYIFDDVTKEYKWFNDENYEQSVERFRPWYD